MELIVARPEMNSAGDNERRVRPMAWAALFAGQLFVCLTPALSQAQGQGEVWPSRSVRLLVPSGSGGAADFTARTFAKFAEQLAERHRGIIYGSAEDAGMQVAGWPMQNDFKRADAAQAVGQCGQTFRGHAGVGNHYRVA